MKENIEVFIQKLKTCNHNNLNQFANQFNKEKYELILKLKNVEPLSKCDWDLVLGKYEQDIHMAKTLIIMPHISDVIKNEVVENYIGARIAGKDFGYHNSMVKTILENHGFINDYTLDQLYTNCHPLVMNLLRDSNEDINLIPFHTVNRLIKMELEMMKKTKGMPSGYQKAFHCFKQVKDDETLNHVLKNMPSDPKTSEQIATQLINSPYLDRKTKNDIFEQYGCDGERLEMITPEIAVALYHSAVETAYPDNPTKTTSYFESVHIEKARFFIEHLLCKELLPEAEQLDLVNRVISEQKALKNNKMSEMINFVTKHTKSPNVLHLIFKNAVHANDRDAVFHNQYVSQEDVKEQAKLYCQKIKNKIEKGKRDEISDKWIRTVDAMMRIAPIEIEDYLTAIEAKESLLLDAIITCRHTPPYIFEKALKRIDEELSEKQTIGWENMKLKALMNKELLMYGFEDQSYLSIATDTFENVISYFAIYKELVSACLSSKLFTQTPELAEKMPYMMTDIIHAMDYVPKYCSQDDFCEKIKVFFKKEAKNFETEKEMDISEMNFLQLWRAMDKQISAYAKLAVENGPEMYFQLESIADKYVEIEQEWKKREIPQREEREENEKI